MNTFGESEYIFPEGVCNQCNGAIDNKGIFMHEEGCSLEGMMYRSEGEETDEIESVDESELDKIIEEFRVKLDKLSTQNPKKKLKPNITLDWIS